MTNTGKAYVVTWVSVDETYYSDNEYENKQFKHSIKKCIYIIKNMQN